MIDSTRFFKLPLFLFLCFAANGCADVSSESPQISYGESDLLFDYILEEDIRGFSRVIDGIDISELLLHGYQDPLLYAAMFGGELILSELISNSYYFQADDRVFVDAYLGAASENKTESMMVLIRALDLAKIDGINQRALFYSLETKSYKVVSYLLDTGVSISYETSQLENLLHACAASGDPRYVSSLIESGLDPYRDDANGINAIELAKVMWGEKSDIYRALRSGS